MNQAYVKAQYKVRLQVNSFGFKQSTTKTCKALNQTKRVLKRFDNQEKTKTS